MSAALEEMDRKIIEELTRDARQSVTGLARRLHISRAHAYERIARLTRAGVIRGYAAVVDPQKLGLEASAYVMLKLRQNTWSALVEKLRRMAEVHHIALVGGSFDVMLLVRAEGTAALRRVVFEGIQPLPEVVDTQTVMIFEDEDARTRWR